MHLAAESGVAVEVTLVAVAAEFAANVGYIACAFAAAAAAAAVAFVVAAAAVAAVVAVAVAVEDLVQYHS